MPTFTEYMQVKGSHATTEGDKQTIIDTANKAEQGGYIKKGDAEKVKAVVRKDELPLT